MIEQQVHDIRVDKEDLSPFDTGGAIRRVTVGITIDTSRELREQRLALIREILGVYLGTMVERGTIEEMAESIRDALEDYE